MSLGDDREGQTRTRLPDAGDDVYGGARRGGRSSSRSMITVVGVVVLLIAAIAFANRGGDGSGASAGDENKPDASSTAATGTRPVKGKSAGIPGGYAHDEQGAQSAAANFAVTLVSADILQPERRADIVRQVFVEARQPELAAKFDKAYSKEFLSSIGLNDDGTATAGNTYVSRTVPIGTKVTSYSATAAAVEVWCTGVFGMAGESSTNPASSDWFTMTLQLRWANNDWKVDSFSQKDGPAPVPGDNKASSADEMAKAVDTYGGFTYAR
ncbi:hypothetical protein K6168_34540 [Streptomyces sp. FB2]|uniref:hypothetical protein n=1 Tax=Streptomyces sp. FB2 TaxID=2902454 RepID=UPI001F47A0CE|nr:hypothetical protein [Streptomyces sp. FB2]MCF2540752.1 hypothetical protein [Streptomyces sp. FB2]